MKLNWMRLSNFQSFGPEPTKITFNNLTFLIGPNGAGKTAVLKALCRLFAFDPLLRKIQKSDFHVPADEAMGTEFEEREFWIEAEFIFPELKDGEEESPTIPPNFSHMRLDDHSGLVRIRFRLEARLYSEGEIETDFNYVLNVDSKDEPLEKKAVARTDRNNIHVHYLPARRDPANHISYTTNSLLGRILRAVIWENEKEDILKFTNEISETINENEAVESLGTLLAKNWQRLHKGTFYHKPELAFRNSEMEALLKHLSISFTPAHGEDLVDFSRLSDGQKSMLYLTIVSSFLSIGRAVINGKNKGFDVEKLKPAIFTIIAMEEPENSLSPHYLGRVIKTLSEQGHQDDAQSLIATHAPSMLKRVDPKLIRYLRINEDRYSKVTEIILPSESNVAHKFVREAVQAYPELYFSRLVVLGEGASEEIVLPRLLRAKGLETDLAAISIVPLGGRHVNHFWRLLNSFKIPFVTLLDLDLARYQGGWGRIKYVYKQLQLHSIEIDVDPEEIVKWNDDKYKLFEVEANEKYFNFLSDLEKKGVFFSSPLDLDFSMLKAFDETFSYKKDYHVDPDEDQIKVVLGKKYHGLEQYTDTEKKLFIIYKKRFKGNSKPVSHINALSKLSDSDLLEKMPPSLDRLIDAVIAKLEALSE